MMLKLRLYCPEIQILTFQLYERLQYQIRKTYSYQDRWSNIQQVVINFTEQHIYTI
jgi:hypothetical protein